MHFRLRAKEIRVGRKRVLRLMRAHHLLAPSRPRHEHGDPAHAGTIITTRPDEMGDGRDVLIVLILVGLAAYTVLGGADFGPASGPSSPAED